MLKKMGFVLCCVVSPLVNADLVGSYVSEEECTLTVETLDRAAGYADAVYSLRSDGFGSCEWTGLGVGKRTFIDAGIASGATRGFVEVQWPFGPAGEQVRVTFLDTDGSILRKETYTRR
ncbi:hypothetical protein ACXYTJ_15045 [Gilvimarinus sp. F26214L]|uniref:hypothetical protein n=1 Tax=Gilvimarinus sp. DZF01 TaxID=3461371 RepID=UPI00404556D7